MAEKERGWIKFFNLSKSYGFITFGENDENEIFFGGGQVKTDGWIPRQGQGCQFGFGRGNSGRECAINVTRDKSI